MINGYDIICISTSDWKCPWGSRQQIMTRLSNENKVLFVEYQASFLHLLRHPKLLYRLFGPGVQKINENIIVYRPFLNLPFRYYCKTINLLNQRLLLFQLKLLIKRLKFSKILLWIFEPTSYALLGKLKESVSVYHCIDFFKNEKRSPLRKRCIENMEGRLCRRSDIVLVSSNELLIDKININKKTYLIPSAVDESFFNINKLFLSTPLIENLKKIKSAKIGFVGTFDNRIDDALIDFIAEKHQDWAVILIGFTGKSKVVKFLKRKNIHLIEWIDNNLLPAYINLFHVCIIPYKVNEFTKGIFPIKVFEYLSLGKPVVATRLPALEALQKQKFVKIAEGKEEFLKQIEGYLSNDSLNDRNLRVEFAKSNTWHNRIESISEVINDYARSSKYQEDSSL